MAKKTIKLGVTPDGEGGDNLRSAFTKTNENFSELYRDKADKVHTHAISDVTELSTRLSDIGDLSQLTTTAKSNLVAAINEAATSGGGGR